MRTATPRARLRSRPLISLLLALGGCHKVTPQGGNPTMTLLRDGLQKVCVAKDVLDAVHQQIVPKSADLQASIAVETRIKAAAAVSVSFDQTALQSFDKDVTKATCSTMVALRSPNGTKTDSFRVYYTVSPSADDPASFVVTADVNAPRAFAEYLIGDEINTVAAEGHVAALDRQTAEEQRRVLATVSDKWLTGAWIDATEAGTACANGNAIWFERDHTLTGIFGSGRWSLAGNRLHIAVPDAPATYVISDADGMTLTMGVPDTDELALRR